MAKKDRKKKNKQKYEYKKQTHNYNIVKLILFSLSFILYINTIGNEYILDDISVISENRFTNQGFAGIGKILTTNMFEGFMENYSADLPGGRYRPLSQVTFAIEYQFFGDNPAVGHFGNIVLFALTPVMIFLVLLRMLEPSYDDDKIDYLHSIPFLAALLYAVHPIHTEAVANIKGRDEIMAMLLVLTSFYYFLKYFDFENKKYLYSSLIIYFLALLSKENAITYMAVFPLSLVMFRNKNFSDSFKSIIPFLIVSVVFILIRQSIVGSAKELEVPELMNEPFMAMNFVEKYFTIFVTLLLYLKLLFIPYPLTFDYYPYHIPKYGLDNFEPYLAIIIYLGLIYYAFRTFKTNKVISFSILYFIITISIVSNLLISIGTFMNERFLFMPSLAVSIALAYYLTKLTELNINMRNVAIGILAVVSISYSYITIDRNATWKDAFTLFTTDVKTSENSAFGNFAAGGQYYNKMTNTEDENEKKKFFELARKHLSKALEIHPRYSDAALNLGNTYFTYNQDIDSTIKYYKIAYDVYPFNYNTSINLGRLLRDYKQDLAGAAACFKQSIRTNPQKVDAYQDIASVYYRMGNLKEALTNLEIIYSIAPNDKQNLQNLYNVSKEMGNMEKANLYLGKMNAIK